LFSTYTLLKAFINMYFK